MKAKYYIYRNLRTKGFSIKYKGYVIERSNFVIAENVEFKVNEKGRQRVILEKSKNVHAYAVCDKYISAGSMIKVDDKKVVSYNPYIAGYFTCNGRKIENAEQIAFTMGKCYLLK